LRTAGKILVRPLPRSKEQCKEHEDNQCSGSRDQPDAVPRVGGRLVTFMDYDLGYFDDETCRLEPIADPFSPKVLPICPE
jgi:hypothetical protein